MELISITHSTIVDVEALYKELSAVVLPKVIQKKERKKKRKKKSLLISWRATIY